MATPCCWRPSRASPSMKCSLRPRRVSRSHRASPRVPAPRSPETPLSGIARTTLRPAPYAPAVMKHALESANMRACILLLAFLAVAVFGAGCASLPSLDQRVSTTVIADTADTRLARAISPSTVAHASLTGVRALPDAREAFATRMLLAAAADKSIDAQYYIWRGDEVGYLLLEALWNAAERGVRVRLLLDDVGTSKLDVTIAA